MSCLLYSMTAPLGISAIRHTMLIEICWIRQASPDACGRGADGLGPALLAAARSLKIASVLAGGNARGWRDDGTPVCGWDAVTCDATNTSVIGINLSGQSLTGAYMAASNADLRIHNHMHSVHSCDLLLPSQQLFTAAVHLIIWARC